MRQHPVLDQLSLHGVRLGLERIESFLHSIGEPHRAAPVVHVAGTNGKGSVCTFVTASLVCAGYHVGTTISPHVEDVNERIQIDAQPVSDADLVAAIERIDRARWEWARLRSVDGVPLTYFEFLIAAAFSVFAEERVDVAVVEVGLGGRLDASNVVQPLVCACPHIGLDHMEILGDTIAAIAAEKAAIVKPGCTAVIGPLHPDARRVFTERARAVGAELWEPGTHLRRQRTGERWSFATPDGALGEVTLGLRGEHQGANAMVAVGVIHQLRRLGFVVPDEAIREGLRTAHISARLEQLRPGLVIDGAHNPDGSAVLAAWLAQQPRRGTRILLVGMGDARDPLSVVGPLAPYFDEIVTTRCSHPRARDPMELALALRELDVPISAGGPIEEALPEVVADADEVVVAGSLFVAGAARSLVREGALDR